MKPGEEKRREEKRSMATRSAATMATSLPLLLLLLLLLSSGCAASQKGGAAMEVDDEEEESLSHHRLPSGPSRRFALVSSAPPTSASRGSLALAVEGLVHCQHCKRVGTTSLSASTRLAGAKVRLACRSKLNKAFVYKSSYTNAHGYFKFLVEGYDFRLHGGVQSCVVYLVSSPRKLCSKATNINSGRIGASLSRQRVYPDEISYFVGPLAFAPPSCNGHFSYLGISRPPYRLTSSQQWSKF